MANLVCPNPTNINFLSPNGFVLQIQKLPELNYFCQTASLPPISLASLRQATSVLDVNVPGESLEYSDLVIQFLIDEDMKNYQAVMDWMIGLGFPEDYQQYKDFLKRDTLVSSELMKGYSDGTLAVLGSNYQPVSIYKFVDMSPISLSTGEFSSTNTDVQYLVGNLTLSYSYYKLMN